MQEGYFVFDFLSINMPDNSENNMGLSGIHYNLKFDKFYTGLGFYGSVMGERGGFFTLGLNTGFETFITKNLFLNSGIHFGGGGGAGAPDGGGAFILPKLNIGLKFKKFSLSTGYSYINFFDGGKIENHQVHLELQLPFNFYSSTYKNAEKEFLFSDLKKSKWNKKHRKMSFMFNIDNSQINGMSKYRGKTFSLVGFEINSYLNNYWLYFAKFDGAFQGIPSGYMNIILGIGHHFTFNKNNNNIIVKFGIGSGGGGGIDSKGGFLVYPDISLEQKLTTNTFISINKGYLMNPDSSFETSTFGVGIKYYSEINKLDDSSKITFKGFEFIIKQDAYFNVERYTNKTENLYQISFQINYKINNRIYLAGQTSFANFGNAGAYAEGTVGLGFLSNYFMKDKIQIFAQSLIGGAGGGNIATGQGLIIKPSIGANYEMNSKIAFRTSLGIARATNESMDSPIFSLGLCYQLSLLK